MSTATRLDDDTAHEQAVRHAVAALGLESRPEVVWDVDHHLQGHFDLGGRHMVLIAARVDDHQPRVLTEDDWDGFRRSCCRLDPCPH